MPQWLIALSATASSNAVFRSWSNFPNQHSVRNGIVARASYLQSQTDVVRNTLKAWLEGVAYALSPRMKSSVIETITKRLKIADPALAMGGYEDLLQATDRKAFPSLERLRNVQRLMKRQTSAAVRMKPIDFINGSLM